MPLSNEPFELGRTNVWPGGAFSDKRASRHHGLIRFDPPTKKYRLHVDQESTNGTFLNGDFVALGTDVALEDGDEIRIGKVYHIMVHNVKFAVGGMSK